MIGVLTLLFNIAFIVTACSYKPAEHENVEYIKEEFTFKFKNASDETCYVEIKGRSYIDDIYKGGNAAEANIDFPTVLRTEISAGTERSITVKDVVVSAKNKLKTYKYEPRFTINVSKSTSSTETILDGDKSFTSSSKEQYTKGTFIITKERNYSFYNSYKFKIEFKN